MDALEFRPGRFLDAQERAYLTALQELRAGRKRSHWIWYVFPQLRGLGQSPLSEIYGIADLAEARAYLANPVLRQRLIEATQVMLAHTDIEAASILGELDALKFRSCLTLFSLADPAEPIFITALERFFNGEKDAQTLTLLKARGNTKSPTC